MAERTGRTGAAGRGPGAGRDGTGLGSAGQAGGREGSGRGTGWGGQAAVRGPGRSLVPSPPCPRSAVPGAGPEGPPRSRAAAPGLLDCRRCRYLRTGRGERGGRGAAEPLPRSRGSSRPSRLAPGPPQPVPAASRAPPRPSRERRVPGPRRAPTSARRLPACCQMAGALLAALILVCSSVSCGPAGGYTGLPGLGGIYYYQYGGAYSGFSGAEGEKAQQLDQRFYLLKLPVARAAVAVGACLLVFSCALIVVGALRVPWRFPAWLLLECVLDVVVAVGIVPALYYFFHFLLGVYNSPVCKEREQLYQSKGYRGFSCSLHGAEIAAGLSGAIAAMAHLLGAGLAVRGYRTVHKLKQKPVQLDEF
ncbi:MARVEL domain-containing protein 3 [Nyctibius grandis]|uniref:MARVEL domain-containing protein 3 n=1 Tax=Nyctibius grandis TaxID=48427 RepID=UPI0035BC843F